MTAHEGNTHPELPRADFGSSSWITALLLMFINIVPVTVFPILSVLFAAMYGVEFVLAVVLCAFRGKPRRFGIGLVAAIATTAFLYLLTVIVTVAS
ncbi:hypothetical protein [Nocardia carnea]|uniref:hypothetical protein n=1 Tax=Nocardia carnea TaxID=37328 RepID=UPI002455AC50|nr:hypothetical protein [Nocardia carnea]